MTQFSLSIVTILLSVALAQANSSSQSPSAQPPAQKSKQSTGDIDMNQFKNLKPKPQPADSGANIQVTCTDPKGALIKKGERGFDTCLANAQSPVMNQPRETEKENDPRKP